MLRDQAHCESLEGEPEFARLYHAYADQLDELADAMPRLLTHLIIAKGRSDCE